MRAAGTPTAQPPLDQRAEVVLGALRSGDVPTGGERDRTDRRVETALAIVSATVLVLIGFMIVFVFQKAWPSFSHNGLAWFGPGGNVDNQLTNIFNSPADPSNYVYTFNAWPLLYATVLITGMSVALGIVVRPALGDVHRRVRSRPAWRRILEPVVRLLAAVPSVVYGLIGILVLVPFVGNHIISEQQKASVQYVIQLDGSSISVGILVLTVMITPIMIAIDRRRPAGGAASWNEGAAALGVNRWRALWTVSVRAARPAIVAADGPRHGPRARRGDHALDGHRLDRVRPEPARRTHLLRRAGAAAGGDDRRQRRGPLGEAVRADDLRLRGGPARLERVPLVRRLVRAPDPSASTRSRRDEHLHADTATTCRPRAPAGRRSGERSATRNPGAERDRIGVAARLDRGDRPLRDRRQRSSSTWPSGASSTSTSARCFSHPVAGLDQSKTGGFLDPDDRHRRPDHARHGDRDPGRGRDRRLADRVRAPGRAGSRGRVRGRDRRRHAEHRARDLRPADLPAGLLLLPLLHRRRATPSSAARSSPPGR